VARIFKHKIRKKDMWEEKFFLYNLKCTENKKEKAYSKNASIN